MVVISEISSPSSSSSTLVPGYDVFVSFIGFDTRYNFTDHLYNTLLNANINTFLDDEEIETGLSLKPELESAIKASRASIIVLSQNYASSTWCLDKLVLILEQLRKPGYILIPIFYHVEPTDVRKQQNSFGEAMAKHKERMERETNADKRSQWAQKIDLWNKALTQVADLKGETAKGR
ncbi:toll/interleukin-1 receptor-like protein [Cynara cardunculus var. scolymus]|uniref:toll/interleukin-1 receptor-like protein n=1 Tax=Cynara cardunculus var. scolymus TaxID=59895 RepID=UPI000D628A57|nr:toll/interleukin-1 receptor-like protein [Cynara cardunculus var. scolymus]